MSTIERNSNPNSSLRLIYPLSRRKADALPHVAAAPTLKQAARDAGVSYSHPKPFRLPQRPRRVRHERIILEKAYGKEN